MKNYFLLAAMLLFMVPVYAFDVPLEIVNKGGGGNQFPKSPIPTLYVDLEDYVLSLSGDTCTYSLQILDEDGYVVYSTVIAAGTSQVVLPSTLSGEYEIRFVTDDYYYYGYITL